MKKYKNILYLLLGLAVVLLIAFFPFNDKESKQPQKESNTEQSYSEEENDTPPSQSIENNEKEFITTFTQRWTNYKTVYDRNLSVKNMFSKKAQDENSLNVDPKVSIESSGTLEHIYYSETPEQFVVFAQQKINNSIINLVLEITLSEENGTTVIDNLKINRIQTSY